MSWARTALKAARTLREGIENVLDEETISTPPTMRKEVSRLRRENEELKTAIRGKEEFILQLTTPTKTKANQQKQEKQQDAEAAAAAAAEVSAALEADLEAAQGKLAIAEAKLAAAEDRHAKAAAAHEEDASAARDELKVAQQALALTESQVNSLRAEINTNASEAQEALEQAVADAKATAEADADAQAAKVRAEHAALVESLQAELDGAWAKAAEDAEQARASEEAAVARAVAEAREEAAKALSAQRAKLEDAVATAEAERDEQAAKCLAESRARKAVHNKLMELQGNIRVFCRVRPVLESDAGGKASGKAGGKAGREAGGEAGGEASLVNVCQFPDATEAEPIGSELVVKRDELSRKQYEYDRVFPPGTSQASVFAEVSPLLTSVVDGFHATIFAYGQTGSGKTHTMDGPASDRGLIWRSLQRLFEIVGDRSASAWEHDIRVSMLEVYNETIVDLLVKGSSSSSSGGSSSNSGKGLEVRQGKGRRGCYVEGLTDVPVTSAEEAFAVVATGSENRSSGRTNMNAHSSRSHLVMTVSVNSTDKIKGLKASGKLHLIDLAGSERLSKSEAQGARLTEAKAINKSLSALGDVIHALGAEGGGGAGGGGGGSPSHVPFRNSKLTYLLSDSLGGNSKVLMFVNVSPVAWNHSETVCSLKFAERCRKVQLGQAKRRTSSASSSSSSSEDGGSGSKSKTGSSRR